MICVLALKCILSVEKGNFIGYMVSQMGINMNQKYRYDAMHFKQLRTYSNLLRGLSH